MLATSTPIPSPYIQEQERRKGLLNIPLLILIEADIRHGQLLGTVLGLRDGDAAAQEGEDVSGVGVVHVVVLEAWTLHVLEVVVQAPRPDVDAAVGRVILGWGSETC